MQTEKEINKTFNAVVGANLTDVNGFIDLPISQKSSLQIAARKSINDVIETPTYTAYFDKIAQNTEVSNNNTTITNSNQTFDFYDTSIRWIYNLSEKDELRLNFINVYNELQFDENSRIGKSDKANVSDILVESAISTILDCEDSVATVDADDKILAYRNWLGLVKGDLQTEFKKNNSANSSYNGISFTLDFIEDQIGRASCRERV